MSRKKKWFVGKFDEIKVKVYSETKKRYEGHCMSKGKTMQDDLEQYIVNTVK